MGVFQPGRFPNPVGKVRAHITTAVRRGAPPGVPNTNRRGRAYPTYPPRHCPSRTPALQAGIRIPRSPAPYVGRLVRDLLSRQAAPGASATNRRVAQFRARTGRGIGYNARREGPLSRGPARSGGAGHTMDVSDKPRSNGDRAKTPAGVRARAEIRNFAKTVDNENGGQTSCRGPERITA